MNNNPKSIDSELPVQQSKGTTDEIDLVVLFSIIWKGKWLIIATTTVFAILSVLYAINQPNIYKSEVLLVPVSEEQGGGLSSLAGQFGGLASLAGINLGGSGSADKSQMAIEVMKSRQFTSMFIEKHDLLPELMAIKSWNRKNDSITYDEELYDVTTKKWVRNASEPFKPKPSMQEAYKEFKKIVSIVLAKDTGLVKVSIEHLSPVIASRWVNWLVEDINIVMKQRDVVEANKSVDFLNAKLEQTNVADIRAMLYKLIEEQTKTIMFAEVRDEYVFKTIDPALVPEEKVKPKRALICILGTMLGGIIGLIIAFVRQVRFRQ